MFIREKIARGHRYLYLVESVREGKRVRQRTIRALGRKDVLHASGELDRLIASLARHSEPAMVLSDMEAGALACIRIGGPGRQAGDRGQSGEAALGRLGHRKMARQLPALGLNPGLEIGQYRFAQLPEHGEGRYPAGSPLISRSMSKSASIRFTASSASGEIGGARLPRLLPTAMSASS